MQIDYIITNVEPESALPEIGALRKQGDQWYTKEPIVRIQIEFRTALVTSVIIKNYNADQVNIILKNGSLERYYESVINRKDHEWSKYQDREIIISNNEIYDQLILEVINWDQREFKGLKQLRIFGEQDKTEEQVIKKKFQKKEKKKDDEVKEKKEKKQNKQKQEEKKPTLNQWQFYFKEPQQQSQFKDARANLRNLNRSPSPIQQEQIDIPRKNEKLGQQINDEEMIRYNIRDIDPQFLSLHTQLQISSDTNKLEQLNIENLQRFWLK